MNKLIIIKGCSGSGKSSFAQFLVNSIHDSTFVEADFFMTDGKGDYLFDAKRLGYCHEMCRNGVEFAMLAKKGTIILSNTTTTRVEMKPYLDLAAKHGYQVVSLVMEKFHSNHSLHEVPEAVLYRQRDNLLSNIKLL